MKRFATLTMMIFSISTYAMEMPQNHEDVSSIIDAYDKATLTEISNELVKMAAHEESIGEFDLATVHYKRALKIRESIGLKYHKSYASILYLSSNAHFQAGLICEATGLAKDASVEFSKHGLIKFQEKAMKDHEAYGKVCALVAQK